MRILGISAFHRDSAAALLIDGEVVAAAKEERFTRLTLDSAFPARAIRWCLATAGLRGNELDRVVFYEKPLRKFERLLARSLIGFPRSSRSFARVTFLWLGERLWIKNRIAEDLSLPNERVLFVEQARALLSNAFHGSPFDEAALLLIDDVGEWSSTAFGRGHGLSVELLAETRMPHSLGLFASAMTQFLGFVPGEEEHKLEALSAHGEPRFVSAIGNLCRFEGGAIALDERAFQFDEGSSRLFGPPLEQILGPARHSGDPLRLQGPDARDADLAASVQQVLEQRALELAQELKRRVPSENLCLAGLLADNTRLCARLAMEGPFQNVHVPCAPYKAGGALGAASFAARALDVRAPSRSFERVDLGEDIGELEEEGAQDLGGLVQARQELGRRLARGDVVGWVHGRMEFSSRSLGNRVALAHAAGADARTRLLSALRHVEPFLTCPVAMPSERAQEFLEGGRLPLSLAQRSQVALRASPALRALAPAAVHADGKVWPRVVQSREDPDLHALLMELGQKSGVPCVLMTDLAVRGSPLVRNEEEAVEAFRRSALAALVAGTRLYEPV